MSAEAWIAGVAAVLAAAALVVSVLAYRNDKDATRATKRSADSAHTSAVAAEDSARSAREAAELAAQALKVELVRDHEARRPVLPDGPIACEVRRGIAADPDVIGQLTVTGGRDYRVKVAMLFRHGGEQIVKHRDTRIRSGEPVELELGRRPANPADYSVSHVRLRFWPPKAEDGVEQWECPCGLPSIGDNAGGHWERTVPVKLPRPPRQTQATLRG